MSSHEFVVVIIELMILRYFCVHTHCETHCVSKNVVPNFW